MLSRWSTCSYNPRKLVLDKMADPYIPFHSKHVLREEQKILHRDKVHEGVSDVTAYDASRQNLTSKYDRARLTIAEIHPQIHEVDAPRAHFVDDRHEVL